MGIWLRNMVVQQQGRAENQISKFAKADQSRTGSFVFFGGDICNPRLVQIIPARKKKWMQKILKASILHFYRSDPGI